MREKIFILSSLLAICGVISANASDCVDSECDIGPMYTTSEIDGFEFMVPATDHRYIEPGVQAKMLTIKPVAVDGRAPLWDGTNGDYEQILSDRTVSWKDGAPIWDESISNYKKTDFSDWFLQPLPEFHVVNDNSLIDIYQQNMADAAQTRARIDEILLPEKPSANLWTSDHFADYSAQDMSNIVYQTFGNNTGLITIQSDGCPFETKIECDIWRKKPIYRETVSPRSPKLRVEKMDEFLDAVACDINISANDSVSKPLLDRYKMLMQSANACCTDGFVYKLKSAGAAEDLIYKFMADDANFYGFGARCLMMSDSELDKNYPNTSTAVVAADVRNGCLCRGRQWFTAMLAPFVDVYSRMPEFKDAKFYYTYTDGLQRQVTVSVNHDVQNVLKQLSMCP